ILCLLFTTAVSAGAWANGVAPRRAAGALPISRAPRPAPSRPELALQIGHSGAITGLVFTAGGALVPAASEDGTARRGDGRTGQLKSLRQGHQGRIHAITVSPDGATLVTAGQDGTARVWDARTGSPKATLPGFTAVVRLRFSPDGMTLATWEP